MKKVLRLTAILAVLGFVVGLTFPALPIEALNTGEVDASQALYKPGDEITELRGRSYRVYQGETPNSYVTEFVGSPEFTKSALDGSWVEYGFTDYGDFYAVQHPWWSVAFYDYYTVVYDETFTEVKIYDDRWVVEYWTGKEWSDAGFWGITRSYEHVEDGIKLRRTGYTTIGQREEIYYFRNGSPCKIEINQTCDEAQTVRFVWKPSGIVADTEHQILPDETDKHAGRVSGLNFYDYSGKFVQTMRWYNELDVCDYIVPVVETSAQGRKATVTFGGFAINAGGIAHLDPDTFYPDEDPETSSVDGFVKQGTLSVPSSWAALRGGAGSDSNDTTTSNAAAEIKAWSTDWQFLYRSIFLFNTAGLPDTCVVTTAVLSLHGHSSADDLGISPNVNIYSSNPASSTALEAGDYNSLGTAAYSTAKAYSSWSTNSYNNFTLNSSGRAAISKTGVSKFGTRNANYDVANQEPAGAGSGNIRSYLGVRYADWGEGYKPKLVVTYTTVPDPPTNVAATDGTYTDKVVITWTKSGGATQYQVYRDGTPLGWLGDVATYNDSGAGTPSITKGTITATDGTYTDKVRLDASGFSTNNGATHTYKVRAKNVAGESGYSGTDTGYRKPGTLSRQWQKSAGDSDASYDNISGATSDPYDYTGAPAPTITPGSTVASDGGSTAHVALSLSGTSVSDGAGRYYRAKYTAAGCATQYTSGDRGYRDVGTLTYQWQKSATDGDTDYDNISGATSSTHSDSEAPAGTITPGTTVASDGTSTANVTLSLSGTSANNGAGRYYKCVLNATGASQQTSDPNRGYRTTGALTYQWQRSGADSDENYSNIAGGTTDPYVDVGAPADGSGRYYKCVLNATGATQQTSASDRGYLLVAPTITTEAATYVEYTTARLNSTLTNDGGEVCEVRFQYNTSTDNWTMADNTTWTNSYTTGQHPNVDVTELAPNTLHYFRAQAKNTAGSVNGTALSFTTENDVLKPTNLKVLPGAEQMVLSWTKGLGSTRTHIRYKEGVYPTDTSDGSLVYSGELGTYTHTELTPGHSYYYSAWGLSGTTYSDDHATIIATTTASSAEAEVLDAPGFPLTWFQIPDPTVLEALPFYATANAFFDAYEVPQASGWFFTTIFGCLAFAIVAFAVSRHPMPPMITLAVALALASLIKLLPMFMMAFAVLFMIGAFKLKGAA